MEKQEIIELTRAGFVVGQEPWQDNLLVNEDETTNAKLALDMYDANLCGVDYVRCSSKYKQQIVSQLANSDIIRKLRQNHVDITIDGQLVLKAKQPNLIKIRPLILPSTIKGNHCEFKMQDASIKYGKYLIIQPQNVTADQKVVEPVCLKFKVTMHDDNGHPYEYQFTNGEIIRLLNSKTVVKHTNSHLVDFSFLPFDKYANQKRPTTGKLVAELDWDDPEAEAERDADLCNAMYDQIGGIFGY